MFGMGINLKENTLKIEKNSLLEVNQLVTENNENFPVGSWLIPADCRKHVKAFYLFARSADDIADCPRTDSLDKTKVLSQVQVYLGVDPSKLPEWALPYHYSLIETNCSPVNGRDLLSAFIQDVNKTRYANWNELIDYCRMSAASVGRVMMDIHGEKNSDLSGSDALCSALQVLNHLQDCKKDYLTLNRVYLPEDWLNNESCSVEHLNSDYSSPEIRRVIDKCLDNIDRMLSEASQTPKSIKRRGLRIETEVILHLARLLSAKLRSRDPIARRVEVSKVFWVWCSIRGILKEW
tara:strand:- start:21860 stop:22738 length:879 start_codon:yes stop_codon:yes gene_type:complete